ncbi:MAG: DNA repair protein RecO [Muribaculaceae bacterium]
MIEKLRGIVLQSIKYSDKNSIVKIFTDTYGNMSFFLPQGGGKVAKMRNAHFMPLSHIEFEANILPGREIYGFRDVRLVYPFSSLYSDPVKNAIVMFITELLGKVLNGSEQNLGLFRYVSTAVRLLDEIKMGTSNFHICFLYHLGSYLGVQPNIEAYSDGYWFDMLNGDFTPMMPAHSHGLKPDDAKVIMMLSRISFSNLHHFKFSREQRNDVLDLMLKYYELHNTTLSSLKSPEILKQLFR